MGEVKAPAGYTLSCEAVYPPGAGRRHAAVNRRGRDGFHRSKPPHDAFQAAHRHDPGVVPALSHRVSICAPRFAGDPFR